MSKTNEAIAEKATELFRPLAVYDFYQEYVEPRVISNDASGVLVEIDCMYESPKRDEAALESFREFLGLKHIDIHYDINEGGCESCDYGSRYGYAIRAWG
jgi:hypothetical protein